MAIEIRVPTLGESVTEATVGQMVQEGGRHREGRRAALRARDRQGHRRGSGAGRRRSGRDQGREGHDGCRRRAAGRHQGRRRWQRRALVRSCFGSGRRGCRCSAGRQGIARCRRADLNAALARRAQGARRGRLKLRRCCWLRQARSGAEGGRRQRSRRGRHLPPHRSLTPRFRLSLLSSFACPPRPTTPHAKSA